MNVFDGFVLVTTSLGKPSFNRKDKKRTKKLLAEAGVSDAKAVRVHKSLFPSDAALNAVAAIDQQIHTHTHTPPTLAFSLAKQRLIKTAKYPEWRFKLDTLIASRKPAIEAFITNYAIAIKNAEEVLGDVFDANDYDSPELIYYKMIRSNVELGTVPGSDPLFRAAQQHADMVAEHVQQSRDNQYIRIIKDHWKHLTEALSVKVEDKKATEVMGTKQMVEIRYDEYLRNGPSRFYQKKIDDIKAQCKFMLELNIANDPEINTIANGVLDSMNLYNLETLKHDPSAREDVADRLQTTMDSDSAASIASRVDDLLG